MKEKITKRFDELIDRGNTLANMIPRDSRGGDKYVVNVNRMDEYQSWLSSSANLIKIIAEKNSHFVKECDRLWQHESLRDHVPSSVVRQMFGILKSAKNEWENGLLRRIEYIISAATFDDFLDHAAFYHRGNKKIESAVLASAVLEDTIKKIARKNNHNPSGKSLEELIDELVKLNIFTPVKAKRIKGYSGVRNSSLHAEWDEFDIRDVGEMIKGVRELVENFL